MKNDTPLKKKEKEAKNEKATLDELERLKENLSAQNIVIEKLKTMKEQHLLSMKNALKSVFLILFFGLSFHSWSQELVYEDNFDNFDKTNTSRYLCNDYWAKYEETPGNFVAFLDSYYEDTDNFGIIVQLEPGEYFLKVKVKNTYGGEDNIICNWIKSGETGDREEILKDALVESEEYSSITTANFTISEAGDYALYLMLEKGGGTFYVDDFQVFKGASTQQCLVPVNLTKELDGNHLQLSWAKPVNNVLVEESFEGNFPPTNWEQKITDDFNNLVTWHKFTEMTTNPSPFDGNACASVFFDGGAPQDEWLITSVPEAATYLDFWHWMSDKILEFKASGTYPDHFYVKISYDGGLNWEILWDAVESCLGTDKWEHVCLYLGNVNANTKIAFQAVSAENDGLYLTWYLDKISFSNPGKEASIQSFNVYKDDVKIASKWESLLYTDVNKVNGTYNYCISANYKDLDCESDKICTEVFVGDIPCNKPKINGFTVVPSKTKEGTFDVEFSWNKPEYSGRDVYYYNCVRNNAAFAIWVEDTAFGQIQVTPGVYRYGVMAVYRYPDCQSEIDYIDIAVGEESCLPPKEITASVQESTVKLNWAPNENAVSYIIYRASEKIAESITDTFYTDENVLNGIYDYCVLTNYGDCISHYEMFSCVSVEIGTTPSYPLPFSEDFSTLYKPKDWSVTDLRLEKSALVWRFDNPGKRDVIKGALFDDMYVILDSDYYGFGALQNSELITPIIDCSKASKVFLSFDMEYSTVDISNPRSDAFLLLSVDGENWITLDTFQSAFFSLESIPHAIHVDYDISKFAKGKDKVQIKWHYLAGFDLWFALDNILVNEPVGVESEKSTKIALYPNPAKDKITIRNSNASLEMVQFYNLTGQLCKAVQASGENISIDISDLKKGLYAVQITTSKGVKIEKLIKE